MKRTPLKRIGVKGKENLKYKSLLKEMELPQRCEVGLAGCLGSIFLTLAHRHKRAHYKTAEELADPKQIIIACVECHDQIEHDSDLTEKIFNKLRGDE
jgi:hypothetical protein